MKKTFYLTIICIALSLTLIATGCCKKTEPTPKKPTTAQEPIKKTEHETSLTGPYKEMRLKLGRIPFTNSVEMVKKHTAFLKYLEERLQVKSVTLELASDYASILDKLTEQKIDIAWLAAMTAIEARENPEIELLVKPVRYGLTTYRGIILARQDSGIRSLKDLKGKKFAWVEKDSATGYIFPYALLLESGIDPEKDFADQAFLKKHDNVVLGVLLGNYDAGACYDDARSTLKDKTKVNELTLLASTVDLPNEPLVAGKHLPAELIEQIKQALLSLNMNTPSGQRILKDLTDVEGFAPVNAQDYDYIAKVKSLLESKMDLSNK